MTLNQNGYNATMFNPIGGYKQFKNFKNFHDIVEITYNKDE